ncbi:site-specific DNA-methyltransferase, partial [Escherichia coli O53:H51]
EYWANSFTKYRNKVGLTSEGKYLDYSSDVVLDFPFKDCVLEGGMTKEEQGKDEVYYNEIIAKDEIDNLFSAKILKNARRYDNDGVKENITNFNYEDNLIIKGNNLIALHSLKVRYAGKIKLIYIDPPYNTGSDSFQYNDTFNHSTWLTFMKNRLEIARELLSNDGVIFVQCDDNEQAYLKVLMDSCFGKQNFIDTFVWKNTDNAPTLAVKS